MPSAPGDTKASTTTQILDLSSICKKSGARPTLGKSKKKVKSTILGLETRTEESPLLIARAITSGML